MSPWTGRTTAVVDNVLEVSQRLSGRCHPAAQLFVGAGLTRQVEDFVRATSKPWPLARKLLEKNSKQIVATPTQVDARNSRCEANASLEVTDVNTKIKQLRDLIVTLDRIDGKLQTVDADVYRAAASAAFSLTYEEMGLLPMSDFAGPTNALQNMAENIHFAVNGRFADLDGTGRAPQALVVGKELIARMRADGLGRAKEMTDSLLARLAPHAT